LKPYSEVGLKNIHEIEKEIKTKMAYIWTFGKNGDGELGIGS
jgi:alpha-tubulin suppressor-like RCC1 family protein